MNNKHEIQVIKSAHKKYVDWWLPIDVASGSLMAPMSCFSFCQTLLTYEGGWGGSEGQRIENWWNEWLSDYTSVEDKTRMKKIILNFIIGHYIGFPNNEIYE